MDWGSILEKTVTGVISAAAVGVGKAGYAWLKRVWASRPATKIGQVRETNGLVLLKNSQNLLILRHY